MTGKSPSTTKLRKAIRLRNAVALYASSVLGSGILVLPGIAAQLAGPGSLLAWLLLSCASYPFAITFASLSARRPESGGVYSFAKETFGLKIATATGWLFALWVITGAPAVTLIAASYLEYAFPLDRAETFLIAFGIIIAALVVNYRGIVISNKVQIATIVSILALLLGAIGSSIIHVRPQNFTPFFPYGFLPIGTAAALIFWSYLGYENVSNVAEEFENPERDFGRSIILSVALISALYVSIAVVTVGTQAYRAGGSVAPFAVLVSNILGLYGAAGTALLAVFIIFGAVNAYTTGMSRVFYAVSRDGGFPSILNHISPKSKVPDRALLTLFGLTIPVFVSYYFSRINLETALLIPSGAAIIVYVIGSAAGVKIFWNKNKGINGSRELLDEQKKNKKSDGKDLPVVFPIISLVISLIVLPFVGPLLVTSISTIVFALVYISIKRR